MFRKGLEADSARTALIIFTCPECGRSVKVYGKVRRVLCACGQTLMETPPPVAAEPASRQKKPRARS